jgi:hypothetical protein
MHAIANPEVDVMQVEILRADNIFTEVRG